MNVQVIEKDGQIEWVVIPYSEFQRMLGALEVVGEASSYGKGKTGHLAGKESAPSTILGTKWENLWLGCMKGTGEIVGDIVSPVDEPSIWNVLAE